MPANKNDCDAVSLVVGLAVCALPLTLLVPDFSIWDVIPKVRISRFHVVGQSLSWSQLNAALVTMIVLFFCLYLELQSRELDELVENVLTVSLAIGTTVEEERVRQAAEARDCLKLLDASVEHYEALIMLTDDLRKRDQSNKNHPPVIELSTSDI